ncbi:MAG: sporulation protein [Elusimicrobia bacterium]|nr:MAG: sporulation protein [Elusimicrobiota bacterium]KAF0155004.1 MAG: sporulation protein [Elusimicrobiota bacterium]
MLKTLLIITLLPACAAAQDRVSVGVYHGRPVTRLTLSPHASGQVTAERALLKGKVTLTAAGGLVRCKDRKALDGRKTVKLSAYGGGVWLSGPGLPRRLHKGDITITARGGRLRVTAMVPIEIYLQGVVSYEAKDLSRPEAFKAQAVAARTYALTKVQSHVREGFNICDTPHCQFYAGFAEVNPVAARAVMQTAGEMITYKGKPISAFYHSACGGFTEGVSAVWPYGDLPYLKSVQDGPAARPYCSPSTGFRWKKKITFADLERALRRDRWLKDGEKISGVSVRGHGKSGRPLKLAVSAGGRVVEVPTSDFYHAVGRTLGWTAMPGNLFELYSGTDHIIMEGKGAGHGVGMCQWGAEGMAAKGFKYWEILEHYYTGTRIEKIKKDNK